MGYLLDAVPISGDITIECMVGGEDSLIGVGTVEIQAIAEDTVDTDTGEILDAIEKSHDNWMLVKDNRLNEALTLLDKTTESVIVREQTKRVEDIQVGKRDSVRI